MFLALTLLFLFSDDKKVSRRQKSEETAQKRALNSTLLKELRGLYPGGKDCFFLDYNIHVLLKHLYI